MRVLRRLAAGLLLSVGVVGAGVAIAAESVYAAGDASLVVSPGQGGPDGHFTTTYRWLPARGRGHANMCVPGQITFQWDGATLGRVTPARVGNTCVAALRSAPPPRAYHVTSIHTITVTNDASVHATYTVTGGQARRPSNGPATATPPTVTDTADTSTAGDPGAPADTASPLARADRPPVRNSSTTGRLIGFGAVLFLAGAVTLGVIVWQRRRPALDVHVPGPRAAADTQPLPLRPPGAHRRSH